MQELADAICVSKPLIAKIEQGNRVITDDVLHKLVEYFRLDKQITNDYRSFLMKETMGSIEVYRIKLQKLEKESKEIEYVVIDPNTGEQHIGRDYLRDESGYIIESYELNKAVFVKKFEDRLKSVIDQNMKEHEGYNEYGLEQAILEAKKKVAFYQEIVNLDFKADPYIFDKIVRALTIATTGGFDSDSFICKLVKMISEELEQKEKERQERATRYGKSQSENA